jgi:NitT/TauT family transport system substrate-binding protein
VTLAISRRAFVGGLAGLAAAGCARAGGEPGVVRFGLMANLTHAPALAGLASGRIAKALGATRLTSRTFRAGPRVLEALLGGAIDVGVSGPAPIVSTHSRHPSLIGILSGVSSGGASFVVAKGANVAQPSDLRGKTLATPQIGSTPDVAIRKYLRAHGLESKEKGGDVRVLALASSDIRAQMMRGRIDGAWLPEPWATRLVGELGAVRFVDERSLWPGGKFPTALLITRADFLRARPAEVRTIVEAVRAEVERAVTTPATTEEEAYGEIERLVTNAGPRPLFHEAWKLLDFTNDPLPDAVETFAKDAFDLGLVPRTTCAAMFDRARA